MVVDGGRSRRSCLSHFSDFNFNFRFYQLLGSNHTCNLQLLLLANQSSLSSPCARDQNLHPLLRRHHSAAISPCCLVMMKPKQERHSHFPLLLKPLCTLQVVTVPSQSWLPCCHVLLAGPISIQFAIYHKVCHLMC
ncbi:uncharacterized protein DS421_2g54320 [Arachis hypogaea]|nr:uncharacterized protein DS421_2g54320 [Arachis hypogaea]